MIIHTIELPEKKHKRSFLPSIINEIKSVSQSLFPSSPPFTSQAELDAYWRQHPIEAVSYLKYKDVRVRSAYHLYAFLGKETNFGSIKWDLTNKNKPLEIIVVNCGADNTLNTPVWRSLNDFERITTEEYDAYIANNASLSNQISKWVRDANAVL